VFHRLHNLVVPFPSPSSSLARRTFLLTPPLLDYRQGVDKKENVFDGMLRIFSRVRRSSSLRWPLPWRYALPLLGVPFLPGTVNLIANAREEVGPPPFEICNLRCVPERRHPSLLFCTPFSDKLMGGGLSFSSRVDRFR